MTNVWPVYKKEIQAYFASPIAYALLFIFSVVVGAFFYLNLASFAQLSFQIARSPYAEGLNPVDLVLSPLFVNINVVMLLMIPALTMRLLAEEKKSGTLELLSSYPLRDGDILAGKYLAALTVFAVMLGLTGAYQLILWALGASMPGVVLTGYVGLLLSGGAYIAVGLFVSSTTENQIVAAVVAFGLLLLFWVIGWAANLVGPFLGSIFQHVSLTRHMEQFSKGVLDWGSLVYLLCFIAFFLFLSLRSLESKRWRA